MSNNRYAWDDIEDVVWGELAQLAEHGFTPHITLKYISPTDPMPIDSIEPLALMFDKIYLHWGDEVKEYTLDEGKR